MAISIFRWADGPYLAFEDPETNRSYLLDACRAQLLLDRLGAHVGSDPDRTLVIDRHVTRDPCRDLTVTDIYIQDCDNIFEVITATAPMLSLSPIEGGTLLLLAVAASQENELQPARNRFERMTNTRPLDVPPDIAPVSTPLPLPIWALGSVMAVVPDGGIA